MTPISILLFGFIAILSTQIMNYFFSKIIINSTLDIVKIGLIYAVPVILINIFYMIYYSLGIKQFPFVVLFLMQFFIALLLSNAIQYFFLKQDINKETVIGIIFVIIGILIMNKSKILSIFQ